MAIRLKKPAFYFPVKRGHYDITPGLRKFGFDFGNGEVDQRFIQIDSEYNHYIESKEACRRERISKYYVNSNSTLLARQNLCRFLVQELSSTYPDFFKNKQTSQGAIHFMNLLRGEEYIFDSELKLLPGSTPANKYIDAVDALASQIQEDVAIHQLFSDGTDRLTLTHVCSPGQWSPEEKTGMSFKEVHVPVPQFEKFNDHIRGMVEGAIRTGPYVRFVWGIYADPRLNHHTEPPPGLHKDTKESAASFHLRVERQSVIGNPESGAFFFLIRPFMYPFSEVLSDQERFEVLEHALHHMDPKIKAYKGLDAAIPHILHVMHSTVKHSVRT